MERVNMRLFPVRRGQHKLGVFLIALIAAPSTFAQTPSAKTANPTTPEAIPVVQAHQRTSSQKSQLQRGSVSTGGTIDLDGINPRPNGATSFTNATAITITDCPNPCPASGQAASLYPSPITVSGEV